MPENKNTGIEKNHWLANPNMDPHSQVRLFCFPYSGAGSSIFRTWLAQSPPGIEICPVILPGRESHYCEDPISDLANLVDCTARALSPYFDRPFAFFGHSLGALISFELARYLRRKNDRQPVQLFVSAHRAPHINRYEEPIHNLPEGEFVARLRELNGMDEAILACSELLDLLIPVLRADFAACETYQYEPEEPLDCPITVFGGLADPFIGREDLLDWNLHTRGQFRLRMLPGDHFFLHHQTAILVELIVRELYTFSNLER